MATVTHDDLSVCEDCLSLIANGTISDDLDPTADEAHAARMDALWPGEDVETVCPEDCDGWFSWAPCDGCGSTLGGTRHPAVVLA
jgi:hypothetical protein